MRVLVTGGAGFVGSNLVDRLLAEDHQVDVVDDLSAGNLANLADARRSPNGRMTFHQLDVSSAAVDELVGRLRPDVVYHLAGRPDRRRSVAEPVADAELNLFGALRVLDAARRAGAGKFVFTACASVLYGRVEPEDLPVRESHPRRPVIPLGVAQSSVVSYLEAYRELHSLEFSALALADVYGPRQESGLVVDLARRLVSGRPASLSGSGRQTLDLVYVDDAVDALARAAERGGGLLLNIGTGTETAVADLYTQMAAALGVDLPAVQEPSHPGDPPRTCVDPSRAALHLGWRPWTGVEDGTGSVLDWVGRHLT